MYIDTRLLFVYSVKLILGDTVKNIIDIFKRFITYKWSPNFISTIFRNEKMETISEPGFHKIDHGCLTASNSFFVKLVCSVIIIIFTNLGTITFESAIDIIKQNWIIPALYIVIAVIPNFIIYTTKKNRFVKRYPKLYYNMLILVLIAMIEVIFTAIYFINSFDSSNNVLLFTSIIGLIANFATLYGYVSIMVGIIDFCIFTNKIALDKKTAEGVNFGDYIDYF